MQRKVTICPVCQNEQIEWDYRFCPICGTEVKEKAPDKCENCIALYKNGCAVTECKGAIRRFRENEFPDRETAARIYQMSKEMFEREFEEGKKNAEL